MISFCDLDLLRACQACHEAQAVAVRSGYLAQGVLHDNANFSYFRVLTLLTDDSGAANTFVESFPRSRSSRDHELWVACHACYETQAVAVGGGCLAQGDLPDIANFVKFRVFAILTAQSVAEVLSFALLPGSRSSRDPELWRACQACHEAQAVAVGGGYLAQGDLPDIANFVKFRVLDLHF